MNNERMVFSRRTKGNEGKIRRNSQKIQESKGNNSGKITQAHILPKNH